MCSPIIGTYLLRKRTSQPCLGPPEIKMARRTRYCWTKAFLKILRGSTACPRQDVNPQESVRKRMSPFQRISSRNYCRSWIGEEVSGNIVTRHWDAQGISSRKRRSRRITILTAPVFSSTYLQETLMVADSVRMYLDGRDASREQYTPYVTRRHEHAY